MFIKRLLLSCALLLLLSGCQEDLFPESETQQAGPGQVGETVIDFNSRLNTGDDFLLSNRLVQADAVVLYFTMWCVVCDSHTSEIKNHIQPNYPNVDFILVDYISSSNSFSRSNQQSTGFTQFDVISDTDSQLEDALSGTMGTIVVIDKNAIIQMNEYFSSSSKLTQILDSL